MLLLHGGAGAAAMAGCPGARATAEAIWVRGKHDTGSGARGGGSGTGLGGGQALETGGVGGGANGRRGRHRHRGGQEAEGQQLGGLASFSPSAAFLTTEVGEQQIKMNLQ